MAEHGRGWRKSAKGMRRRQCREGREDQRKSASALRRNVEQRQDPEQIGQRVPAKRSGRGSKRNIVLEIERKK